MIMLMVNDYHDMNEDGFGWLQIVFVIELTASTVDWWCDGIWFVMKQKKIDDEEW